MSRSADGAAERPGAAFLFGQEAREIFSVFFFGLDLFQQAKCGGIVCLNETNHLSVKLSMAIRSR